MGYKSYLRVDGIRGTSYDLGHVGELEISQFSYTYGGKSKSENVQVSISMELEPAFGIFYDKMVNNQKLKDATLTVETRNQFGQLSQTFKAEMKGLKVTGVSSQSPNPYDVKTQSWPIQRVSFLVDTIQLPQPVQSAKWKDEWKDS